MSTHNDKTDSEQTGAELATTRRDFSASMATSMMIFGWFSDSDTDSPELGWMNDFAIANEEKNVAIDPEIIRFVGDFVEVEKTHDGVDLKFRSPGEVAVDGEDIHPASVHTPEAIISEALSFDRSQYNPHPTRRFEESGPLTPAPHPSASNPVLTAADVSDWTDVKFVADPFIVYDDGLYRMFVETYQGDDTTAESGSYRGVISHATSPDGLNWTYDTTVLDPGHHMSFPQVFKWEGTWYMVPSHPKSRLKIWSTDSLPGGWTLEDDPSFGHAINDPAIFKWEGTWYFYSLDVSGTSDVVRLYYADSLIGGSWTEHPSSPVSTDASFYKNGGRPIVRDDYIDVPVQDHTGNEKVNIYRVTELSKDTYSHASVATNPVLQRTYTAWNENGMHHLDALLPFAGGKDLIVVDGKDANGDWAIGVYTTADRMPASAKAYLGADYTLSSGAWGQIPLDALDHDTAGAFDTAANEYVIPRSGYYRIAVAIGFNNTGETAPYRTNARLITGGGEVLAYKGMHAAEASNTTPVITTEVHLTEGTSVILEGFQDTGAGMTVTGAPQSTYMNVRRSE